MLLAPVQRHLAEKRVETPVLRLLTIEHSFRDLRRQEGQRQESADIPFVIAFLSGKNSLTLPPRREGSDQASHGSSRSH